MNETQPIGHLGSLPEHPPRRWRLAATVAAVVAIAGTGAGAGVAIANSGTSSSSTAPTASTSPAAQPAKGKGKHAAGKAPDPAREAWAHQYGLDRSTMANLPDVGAASKEQQAAATDLLVRTEAATAQYSDPAKAAAAGFDIEASLAKAEKKRPGKAGAIQRFDAGGADSGRMPMLHVANKANKADGKILDPAAPETLMYAYQGGGKWALAGVMYTANESYPQAPPDPGGPITRWHYHSKGGGDRLMMHIFFVPGNDLAHAYAAEMSG